jgi:hypothetical protein
MTFDSRRYGCDKSCSQGGLPLLMLLLTHRWQVQVKPRCIMNHDRSAIRRVTHIDSTYVASAGPKIGSAALRRTPSANHAHFEFFRSLLVPSGLGSVMTNEEFFKSQAERCLELAEQFAPSIVADGFKVLAADYAKQAAKSDVLALA